MTDSPRFFNASSFRKFSLFSGAVMASASLLLVGCGGDDAGNEAPSEPAVSAAPEPAPAPAPAPNAAPTPPADAAPAPKGDALGRVAFEVTGGENAGVYAGGLSEDSALSIRNMGASKLVTLRAVHEPSPGVTVLFNLNCDLPDAVPGKYDVSGKMVSAAVLNEGDKSKNVGVNAALGSGSVEITKIDPSAGAIEGTFVVQEGDRKAEGRFVLNPR